MAAKQPSPDWIDPARIEANLGLKTDPNTPPDPWVQCCTANAQKIRRLIVNFRRGRSTYQPMPGCTFDYPEIDPEDSGEETADDRIGEPKTWGRAAALDAWRAALEYSDMNGRPLDVQLVGLAWDPKKNDWKIIFVKAKNIPAEDGVISTAADLADGGATKILAWVVVQQQATIATAHARADQVYSKLESLLAGVERGMGLAFKTTEEALKMREEMSAAAATERKEQRDFIRELVESKAREGIWKEAISTLGPTLETIAEEFMGGNFAGAKSWQKRATDFVKSVSDDQKKQAAEIGLTDVITDLLSSLDAVGKTADPDQAKAIIVGIAPKVNAHADALGPILSDEQRLSFLWLLKFAGLPV